MARKVKRIALVFAGIAALVLPLVVLGIVLHSFAIAAEWEIERRGLPEDDHNAVKHAYAAAETYSLARLVAGPERAAAFVIWLGEANEWAERYIKHTTDWSPEVYKDLRNNLAGIAAAEWLYQQAGYTAPGTRLELIGRLAGDNLLVPLETDPRVPDLPQAPDTAAAIARMQADESGLLARLSEQISALGAALRVDLGL